MNILHQIIAKHREAQKKKELGCLYGKTEQEINQFFESLANFSKTDSEFFTEQYWDLTYTGRKMFENYIKNRKQKLVAVSNLILAIEKITTHE